MSQPQRHRPQHPRFADVDIDRKVFATTHAGIDNSQLNGVTSRKNTVFAGSERRESTNGTLIYEDRIPSEQVLNDLPSFDPDGPAVIRLDHFRSTFSGIGQNRARAEFDWALTVSFHSPWKSCGVSRSAASSASLTVTPLTRPPWSRREAHSVASST